MGQKFKTRDCKDSTENELLTLYIADPIWSPRHHKQKTQSTEPTVNPEYCQVWPQNKT